MLPSNPLSPHMAISEPKGKEECSKAGQIAHIAERKCRILAKNGMPEQVKNKSETNH